jgi:hypothetical protein
MDVGVNVAVVPVYVTVPGTAVVPFDKVKVEALMVVGFIAVLKETVNGPLRDTPTALAAGLEELTVGAGPGSLSLSLQPTTTSIVDNASSLIFDVMFIFILFK